VIIARWWRGIKRRRGDARTSTGTGTLREPGVTPAQAADLAAAREAQARVREQHAHVRAVADVGLSRWPRVEAVRGHLERVRQENHLAADLKIIFRGDH
jgi:hypothetical protein